MTNVYVYEAIAAWVAEQGRAVTRAEVARQFGITKSTAIGHLDKLVKRKMLHRYYAWTTHQSRGWLYATKPPAMTFEEYEEGLARSAMEKRAEERASFAHEDMPLTGYEQRELEVLSWQ